MTVEIPRCKQARWDAGRRIVCGAQLMPVAGEIPVGADPGLSRFLCPHCGSYCWIHMSLLPKGFSREADSYHSLRDENGG